MEMEKLTVNKIAEVSVVFWVLKILATTLGETTGDMLAHTLNLGYAVGLIVTGVILVGLVVSQVRLKSFSPWLFWATIIGTTTVGTEISDFMDRSLGLGYVGGSIVLVIGLALSLLFWYIKEGNIKVDSITQKFPEIMFWIAVLFSNSLGTAFGDYLSDNLELSYIVGALITASIIASKSNTVATACMRAAKRSLRIILKSPTSAHNVDLLKQAVVTAVPRSSLLHSSSRK